MPYVPIATRSYNVNVVFTKLQNQKQESVIMLKERKVRLHKAMQEVGWYYTKPGPAVCKNPWRFDALCKVYKRLVELEKENA